MTENDVTSFGVARRDGFERICWARVMQIVSAGRVTTASDADARYLNGSAATVAARRMDARGTTVGQVSVALVGPRVHLARIRGPTFRAPGARVPPDKRRRTAGTHVDIHLLNKYDLFKCFIL